MHQKPITTAAGIVCGSLFPLPFTLVTGVAVVALALMFYRIKGRWPVSLFLLLGGMVWGCGWTLYQMSFRLPDEEPQDRLVNGTVAEVLVAEDMTRFRLNIDRAQPAAAIRSVQLSWRSAPPLNAGDQLEARVRLRSPRAFLNGLPFDYEAWLLAEGVDATGYVREGRVVLQAGLPWRDAWIRRLQQELSPTASAWVLGLVFGDQNAFTQDEWQLAQLNGTVHLMVVSGMHIGLVALAGWWFGRVLRAPLAALITSGNAGLWLPGFFLLLATGFYLWLAGSGVALQRAWLMLAVWILFAQTRLRLTAWQVFSMALLLVLIANPLMWTRPGFGLSFTAVLLLILLFPGRQQGRSDPYWLPQWLIFLGLMPLLLLWGQVSGPAHLLANLLAIPLVTLLLLPLSLLAFLLPADLSDQALVFVSDVYWAWLRWCAQLPLPLINRIPWPVLPLWYGVLWLLYTGVNRLLVLVCSAIMTLAVMTQKRPDTALAVMADVGQGQALLFSAGGESLIYDTGPAYSGRFNAGSGILLPLLAALNVPAPQIMVISHSDSDHAGGLLPLLSALEQRRFAPPQVFSGQSLQGAEIILCHAQNPGWRVLSERLRWRILPADFAAAGVRDNDNNASCVIQVVFADIRFLLTGDIGVDAELAYVRQYGDELKSDVLVLAHHGSKSSSSELFLRTVNPDEAWISAGYANRFGHPHGVVTERLQALAIPWRNTAQEGAVFRASGDVTRSQIEVWQPLWRNR